MTDAEVRPPRRFLRIYLLLGLAVLAVGLAYVIVAPSLVARDRADRGFVRQNDEQAEVLAELSRLVLITHVDVLRDRSAARGAPADIVGKLAANSRAAIKVKQDRLAELQQHKADPRAAELLRTLNRRLQVFEDRPGSRDALDGVMLAVEQLRQLDARRQELPGGGRRSGPLEDGRTVTILLLGLLAAIVWAGAHIVGASRATSLELGEAIRQREEQANALRLERDVARNLTDIVPAIILLIDPQGRIVYVNPFFEQLTGWRLDEIRGKDWFSTCLPAGDRERIRELFQNALFDLPTRGNINRIITRDGGEREIEWNDQIIRDADGRVVRLLAIGLDETQRMRAERSLRDERDRLRQILDSHFGFVTLLSLDGVVEEINQAPLDLGGLTREAVLGRRFWDIGWLGPDGEALTRAVIEVVKRGELWRGDVIANFPGLGRRVVDAVFSPLRDFGGVVRSVSGFGIDVTERRRADDRLREAQRIARLGSWERDLATNLFTGSTEFWRITGIDDGSLEPSYEAFLAAVHPEDRAAVGAACQAAVADRTPCEVVHRLLLSDGSIKWVHLRVQSHYDTDGRPLRSMGTLQDITERRNLELELRKSEVRYTLVEKAVHEGIWDWQVQSDVAFMSAQWKGILGYRDEELPNNASSFFDLVHPGDSMAVKERLERTLLDGAPYDHQMRLRHKDGTYRWVRSRGEALRDAAGLAVRMVGSISDITDQLATEKKIAEQSRLLDLIFKNTLDSIVVLDKDYNFVRVSESYARGSQMEVADLLGRNHFEVFPSPFEQELEPSRREKTIFHATARPFVFPEHPEWGTTYWDLAMVPILDADGEIEFHLFTLRDVTERRRAEEALRRSLAEKEILLREIHHRVKNNLQIIASLLHFQIKRVHTPEDGLALLELRQRIFAMSMVHERLYQSADLALVNFNEYVQALVAGMDGSITRRNLIRLHLAAEVVALPIEKALPAGLIVCELVTNVMKYAFPGGQEGHGTVSVRADDDRIILDVDDDGVGFPEGFDPGSGESFGWELVRILVLQLDGTVEATSDRGAHVRVVFPVPAGSERLRS